MSTIDFLHAGEQTKAIHAGETPDPVTKASAPNLVMSTTFLVDADTGFSVEGFEESDTWIYTRWGNPTIHQLEQKLAALEQAETAIAFASGMGAITALLPNIAPPSASPCPPRYLVSEWITKSAPSNRGFVDIGVAKVESTASLTPASWAIAATAAISVNRSNGLHGVSI